MIPEPIAEKLQNLPDIEVPRQLHVKVMRRIYYAQFRTPLNILLSLLVVSAANSLLRLWQRLDTTGALDFLKDFITTAEFGPSYMFDSLNIFFSFISPALIIACILNLVLLSYVLYLHITFRNKAQRSNLL